MNELYINVEPYSIDGFLKIFDLVLEDTEGDIAYHVENYNGKAIKPDDLIDYMVTFGYGIFGVSCKVPELVEKMNMEVIEDNGHHFVIFNLAPFLGLPGNEPLKELQELKELLTWVKDEALKNPTHKVKLVLDRWHGTTNFKIVSNSKDLEKKLQEELSEKINQSETLTQWVENQKSGFKKIERRCKDLFIGMDSLSLMNMKEQQFIFDNDKKKIPNKIKLTKKGFF